MKIRQFAPALLSALLAQQAYAYGPEQAANNLAHDFANCAAYYMLVAKGSGGGHLATNSTEAASQAFDASIQLTSEKLAMARYNMALKSMMHDMNNSFANFSIVINDYADLCKELMENVEARHKYWLQKED